MIQAYDLKQKSNFSETVSNSFIEPDIKIQIEQLEGRQQHIFAQIQIPYPLEQVWEVLTDYEALAEFMPGLRESRCLERSPGGVRVEQISTKSFMGMKFSTRSVLDIEEKLLDRIHYRLVEGDMEALSGYWQLNPLEIGNATGVELIYNFLVCPKRILPMAWVEQVFRQDLPETLLAIRQRVEELHNS